MDLASFNFRVTKLLASEKTPLPLERGNIRNLSQGHRHQGAYTLDRLRVAMNVSTSLVLDRLGCEDAELWCMVEEETGDFLRELLKVLEDSDDDDDDDPLFGVVMLDFELADEVMKRALREVVRPRGPSELRTISSHTTRIIDSYSDSVCRQNFRFSKVELKELFASLHFPVFSRSKSGRIFQPEESFLIMMRRLAKSPRFIDIEEEFGYRSGALCESFNGTMQWVDWQYGHLVDGTASPPPGWGLPTGLGRWSGELAAWAAAVLLVVAIGIPQAIFGFICCFIDGTFRSMSRPGSFAGIFDNIQRVFYTRYKKAHGIVFQLIMAPNGIFIDM